MSKRYVLFFATSELSEGDVRQFSKFVRRWHQGAKVIQVKGNPRALIVKTTNEVAPRLRDLPGIRIGETELDTILTSGAIGNLKKRASEPAANGKVP
jgi:aminoglycoside phosphotransferase family enzyme